MRLGYYVGIWFLLACSLLLLLRETRTNFFFFYESNKRKLCFIIAYFAFIQVARVLQITVLATDIVEGTQKDYLEMDNIGYSVGVFIWYIAESVGPTVIFCVSSDFVDYHALIVHNSDSSSMRSLFVQNRAITRR